MSSNTAQQASKTNFDNYQWVRGMKERFDSVSVRIDPDGRVALGVKGWDSKHNGPGYIQAEMTTDGLRLVLAHIVAALAAKEANPLSDIPRPRAA